MSSFVSLGPLVPQICIEVDATTDPTSPTRTWTDITPLVRGAGWTRSGRNMELNRSTAGTLDAVVSDEDGAITGLGLRKRQWIRALGKWNGVTYPRWQGILESKPRKWWGQGADEMVALRAADVFKVLALTDLAIFTASSSPPFRSQRNDERVSEIIAFANLDEGSVDTDTDDAAAVSGDFADGSMALPYLLQIEESENGLLIANPDGTVDFQGRHWRYVNALTPVGVFGEAADEIPYFDDVELDDDDSLVANVIRVTPYGASVPVEVINSASTARYWPTVFERQLLSADTALATSAANWLSNRYGDPSPRIPAIRVELAAAAKQTGGTALVTALLGANNSDRFTWKRAASTPIEEDVYVEQISESVDVRGGSWEMAFNVSPALDDSGWVLGSSALSVDTVLVY